MPGFHILSWVIIGLIAGAFAGRVVEGKGYGCVLDVVIGLAGALIGGAILDRLRGTDVAGSFLTECLVAFIGACLLLGTVRLLRGGRHPSPD